MARIELKDFNTGGIADSMYSGAQNSLYKIEGFDIHGEPGVLKSQQAIVSAVTSGDAITQKIVSIVPMNDGYAYLFGSEGAIWSLSDTGVSDLVVTEVNPATVDKSILDAKVFGDYIYYSTTERLGQWQKGTAWSTRNDNFATLSFDDEYHPLVVVENDLYVGHANLIGRVTPSPRSGTLDAAGAVDQGGTPNVVRIPATDHKLSTNDSITIAGTANYNGGFKVVNINDSDTFDIESVFVSETFSTSDTFTVNLEQKLTLESKYTVQSLALMVDKLVIGTISEGTEAGSFSGFSHLMSWDLRSIDLRTDIEVEEFGISAFMDYKGGLLFNAGTYGNWYFFNGSSVSKFRRFPADWSASKQGRTEFNAVSSYKGMSMIGFSNVSGNPALQGVYSFGAFDPKYPDVYNFEFPSVLGRSDDTTIGAVGRIGTDFVFGRTSSVNHTLQKVDTANKYSGSFLETRVFDIERDKWKNFKVTVCYRSLPAGSTVVISQKTNHILGPATSGYRVVPTKIWTNKKTIEGSGLTINANTIQFRVETTRGTDTNTAPEIEKIIIDFE